MSKDQGKYHNRRKVDTFDHKPANLVVLLIKGDGILRQIWNDSGCVWKKFCTTTVQMCRTYRRNKNAIPNLTVKLFSCMAG